VLFNSYDYLLYFLPLSLVGFFALGRRPTWAVAWLVAASLFFYAWWDPRYLPLILGSIAFNFLVGRALRRETPRGRLILGGGIAGNLLLLGVFKYADFALSNAANLLGKPLPLPHLVLPLASASSPSPRSRISSTCTVARRASPASPTTRSSSVSSRTCSRVRSCITAK